MESCGTLDSTEVSLPYPGFVSADNGALRYFGKVDAKLLLVVMTTDIDGAVYLIKNLRVYPKNSHGPRVTREDENGSNHGAIFIPSQENALIEATAARKLKRSLDNRT